MGAMKLPQHGRITVICQHVKFRQPEVAHCSHVLNRMHICSFQCISSLNMNYFVPVSLVLIFTICSHASVLQKYLTFSHIIKVWAWLVPLQTSTHANQQSGQTRSLFCPWDTLIDSRGGGATYALTSLHSTGPWNGFSNTMSNVCFIQWS